MIMYSFVPSALYICIPNPKFTMLHTYLLSCIWIRGGSLVVVVGSGGGVVEGGSGMEP